MILVCDVILSFVDESTLVVVPLWDPGISLCECTFTRHWLCAQWRFPVVCTEPPYGGRLAVMYVVMSALGLTTCDTTLISDARSAYAPARYASSAEVVALSSASWAELRLLPPGCTVVGAQAYPLRNERHFTMVCRSCRAWSDRTVVVSMNLLAACHGLSFVRPRHRQVELIEPVTQVGS